MRVPAGSFSAPVPSGTGAFLQRTASGGSLKVKRNGKARGYRYIESQSGRVQYLSRSWRYLSTEVRSAWQSYSETVPYFQGGPGKPPAGGFGAYISVGSLYLKLYGSTPPVPDGWNEVEGFQVFVGDGLDFPSYVPLYHEGFSYDGKVALVVDRVLAATPAPVVDDRRVYLFNEISDGSEIDISNQLLLTPYSSAGLYSANVSFVLLSADLSRYQRSSFVLLS